MAVVYDTIEAEVAEAAEVLVLNTCRHHRATGINNYNQGNVGVRERGTFKPERLIFPSGRTQKYSDR